MAGGIQAPSNIPIKSPGTQETRPKETTKSPEEIKEAKKPSEEDSKKLTKLDQIKRHELNIQEKQTEKSEWVLSDYLKEPDSSKESEKTQKKIANHAFQKNA